MYFFNFKLTKYKMSPDRRWSLQWKHTDFLQSLLVPPKLWRNQAFLHSSQFLGEVPAVETQLISQLNEFLLDVGGVEVSLCDYQISNCSYIKKPISSMGCRCANDPKKCQVYIVPFNHRTVLSLTTLQYVLQTLGAVCLRCITRLGPDSSLIILEKQLVFTCFFINTQSMEIRT